MDILPKAIYRFNAIPIKIKTHCLEKTKSSKTLKEQFSNSSGIAKKPSTSKTILNYKGTSGGITIPDHKLCYLELVIKNYMVLVPIEIHCSMD